MNSKYLKIVNSTCRSSGAVGRMAIVPRVLPAFAKKSDKILDFGAGKHAIQTGCLRDLGYKVTAYEIGDNFNPFYHDPKALNKKYDIVYASNVLNVQPSRKYIHTILGDIKNTMKKDSLFMVNYPSDPRKCDGLGVKEVKGILEKHFTKVHRIKKTSDIPKLNVPVWVCEK